MEEGTETASVVSTAESTAVASTAESSGENALLDQSDAMIVCCSCKKVVQQSQAVIAVRSKNKEKPHTFRCNSCNAMRSRINRLLKNREVENDWRSMSQ